MNTPRTDEAELDWPHIVRELPFSVVRAEHARELETELAEVTKERDANHEAMMRNDQHLRDVIAERNELKAKLEKCRTALSGISEYGKMCKGTDAERMKYIADKALDETK